MNYTLDLLHKTLQRLKEQWVPNHVLADFSPTEKLLLGCAASSGGLNWNLGSKVRFAPLPRGQRAPLLEASIRWYYMTGTKPITPSDLVTKSIQCPTSDNIVISTATPRDYIEFAKCTDFAHPVFFMGGKHDYFNAPIVMAMFETEYQQKLSLSQALELRVPNPSDIRAVMAGGKFMRPRDNQKEIERKNDLEKIRSQYLYKL